MYKRRTKTILIITTISLLILISSAYAAIYSPIVGKIAEDDRSFFLIDVTKEDTLTITVSLRQEDLVSPLPDDEITILGIYDPSGNKMADGNCSGEILKTCKIYNPTPGTWLVGLEGEKIYGTGEINVQASYLINNFQVYHKVYELGDYTSQRYDMAQYSMTFFEKYISTSDRNHLAVLGLWDDYAAKYDITLVSPNLKISQDISKEDETSIQEYYLTPGSEAEGRWIILIRSLKGFSPITLYTNYGYLDEIATQQLIEDEIKKADEAKEYPIQVTDTSTPLIISLLEKQSGDSLVISKVFNPLGTAVACTDIGTGCAIQDPQEGIWLVDIAVDSITGTAPFNFASTHHTYEPKDYVISESFGSNDILFYKVYVKTQDKEHMVAVADWTDSQTNIELAIISANVVTKTAESSGDEKNVRLYSLSPGNVAEGKWIVQLASLEGSGDVNISSNYNLTKVATEETRYIDNIAQNEVQTFFIYIPETDIPLVVSLIEKQSGDDVIISQIVNPNGTAVSCSEFASGCAVQDPQKGVWQVNVKGKSITGTAPYVFAATYRFTECGNSICESDLGENCGSCPVDCICAQFEICGIDDACVFITKEVPKDSIYDKILKNKFNILILLLVALGVGYKVYKDKYSF
ncbi:MAG: hypothetical protein U9O53_01105 [archaeon]|nr:hypothetical protein [archaeon]